jgi:hypothetical protein
MKKVEALRRRKSLKDWRMMKTFSSSIFETWDRLSEMRSLCQIEVDDCLIRVSALAYLFTKKKSSKVCLYSKRDVLIFEEKCACIQRDVLVSPLYIYCTHIYILYIYIYILLIYSTHILIILRDHLKRSFERITWWNHLRRSFEEIILENHLKRLFERVIWEKLFDEKRRNRILDDWKKRNKILRKRHES